MKANETAESSLVLREAAGDDERWVVLHTRPRCEKKVVRYCEESGYEMYLPLRKRVHKYGARERVFYSPIFPGYVFGILLESRRYTVQQNQNVVGVLDVHNQAALLEQLRQLQRALSVGSEFEVLPFLKEGQRVEVVGGPFKGIEGLIQRVKGKAKVIINVDMIQQAISVEVDSAYLKPA